jgi:hypothetical protein
MTEMAPIHTGENPAADDRRNDDRVVSVLINAGIAQDGRSALCRIRNLSEAGMMVETRMPLNMDEGVAVQLRSGLCVAGVVRWSKDNRAGIALVDASGEMILADHAQTDVSEGAGVFPRFMRNAAVSLTVNHRRSRCALAAVSLGDAVLSGAADATPGQIVTVAVEGLDERLAKIVEAGDGMIRAVFTQPFHFKALEQWLELETYQ